MGFETLQQYHIFKSGVQNILFIVTISQFCLLVCTSFYLFIVCLNLTSTVLWHRSIGNRRQQEQDALEVRSQRALLRMYRNGARKQQRQAGLARHLSNYYLRQKTTVDKTTRLVDRFRPEEQSRNTLLAATKLYLDEERPQGSKNKMDRMCVIRFQAASTQHGGRFRTALNGFIT